MKKNNLIRNLLTPLRKANIVLMFLMAAGLLYYNLIAGIVAFIISVVIVLNDRRMEKANSEHLINYIENITSEIDETIATSVIYNPLPLCLVDFEGVIIWHNQKFADTFQKVKTMQSNVTELTGVKLSDIFSESGTCEKVVRTDLNKKYFRILSTAIREESPKKSVMLHWLDITQYENQKLQYKNERTCFVYINVDNYDELLGSIPEDKKAIVIAEIETIIRQWGIRSYSSIIRYTPSQYFMAMQNEHLEKMERSKFSVLDEIREIETFADFPASLTIGIGAEGKTPAQSQEFAKAAIELGLGRGGDQVVVKKVDNVEYYGGKLQTVEKRNKGKSRILAHALGQLISQASKVIIMGHSVPDMDSFGAAIGISRLVKLKGKDGYIIIDNVTAVDSIYKEAVKTDAYNFISGEIAQEITDKETLVVVVDAHKPSLVEYAPLLKLTDKIVVIDHHRRGEEIIENPTLSYIEPYASSTSELIAEILEYSSDKKELTKFEAEALLAGIAVDTKNFSVKTGVRTFESAGWLRRQGADTSAVRSYFQTEMDVFKTKAMIISNARFVTEGIAISYSEFKRKNIAVLISMAADEILNIRGTKACVVLGEEMDGIVRVSARSLGEINVQVLMEKIGGGGHFTTAGAQLEMTLPEAIAKVEAVIKGETSE